jgi:hypothetical protein
MADREMIASAHLRRATLCPLILCCVLVACLLVAAGPAAAAAPHDPSYSPRAQREAALHLGLLGAATFDPDNLISDINFSAIDSLSQSAIQSFLATQSGTLDSYRAPDHSGLKRSAAAIIWRAARAWGVSSKVILVTLQKEQGLLTATRPSASALEWAMGCGVPDGGRRDTTYEGFGKQVWYGAESLHDDGQGFFADITKVCGDGTVQPDDQASYALYTYTPCIGLGGGGNKLFWTLYWQYFGDPLAIDTVPPTTSVTGAEDLWHNKPVTLTFSAVDNPGGSGVAYTEYSLDRGETWTKDNSVTIPALAGHANDGIHTVLYRSIDDAGNTEKAKSCTVRIDTRPPKPVAKWPAAVTRGHTASLEYCVSDPRPGSPTATVTIRVKTSAGRLERKLVVRGAAVNKRLSASFVCRLAAGQYRFYVSATDAAGNRQSRVASNLLTVN